MRWRFARFLAVIRGLKASDMYRTYTHLYRSNALGEPPFDY